MWKGRACSKSKTKLSKVNKDNHGGELPEGGRDQSGNGQFGTSIGRHGSRVPGQRRTRLITVAEIFHLFPLGTYQWMCGLVGADVVKISGYEEKTGRSGQVGDVQHVHMYDRKCI